MRKIFLLMATAALVLTGCKKQTFDERVQAEVDHFNEKEAPKRLDSITTFDSMQYDSKQLLLSYFYTLKTDLPMDLFPKEDVKQELLRNLRQSLQLKTHKEHGLLFRYKYILSPSGETLIDCTFTPEDYK
jgi:hypothetical protein